MNEGCKGCARLLRIVNSSNNSQRFCTTGEGILYVVDNEWYFKNDCTEKTKEFKIKGQEWK